MAQWLLRIVQLICCMLPILLVSRPRQFAKFHEMSFSKCLSFNKCFCSVHAVHSLLRSPNQWQQGAPRESELKTYLVCHHCIHITVMEKRTKPSANHTLSQPHWERRCKVLCESLAQLIQFSSSPGTYIYTCYSSGRSDWYIHPSAETLQHNWCSVSVTYCTVPVHYLHIRNMNMNLRSTGFWAPRWRTHFGSLGPDPKRRPG
jgi:hypothetical protein